MLRCMPIPALKNNYIWALINPSSRYGLVIDPGDAFPVIRFLNQLDITLCAILITHHHQDHVGGVLDLLQEHPVPVFGSAISKFPAISHPLLDESSMYIPRLEHLLHTLTIPGHTHDHIAYYDNQHLFCGDTLFLGGCGRVFEGTTAQMLSSLDKLAQLPDNIGVYCAHEYTLANLAFALTLEPNHGALLDRLAQVTQRRLNHQSSIPGQLMLEKQTNPFLRVHNPEFKLHCETKWNCQFADSIALFAKIRMAKDHFQFSEADYLRKIQERC